MPTLKRSVYIGLGGAGIQSICKTKKLFIDTYGFVPPMVQFLGIDTDRGEFDRELESGINLAMNERCMMDCTHLLDFYHATRLAHLAWMPSENERFLRAIEGAGSGQIRTNGRFAFFYCFKQIRFAIQKAVSSASSFQNGHTFSPFENRVHVNLVFSLAGGTGCGIFLDVAYLIRKLFGPDVEVCGYAVLPSVFQEMAPESPDMRNIFPNAYGALQDLDYLMNLHADDEPVTFDWLDDSFTVADFKQTPRPFDWVFLLDNKNIAEHRVVNIRQLSEIVAYMLFMSGSLSGVQIDNYLSGLRHAQPDAWSVLSGLSAVVYDGEKVSDVFAGKTAIHMLHRMLNTDKDEDGHAECWLDENGFGEVRLLDSLYPMNHVLWLDVTDPTSPGSEVQQFCESVIEYADNCAQPVAVALKEHFFEELNKTVHESLRPGDGSIASTVAFLKCMENRLSDTRSRMEEEERILEDKAVMLRSKKEDTVRSLEQVSKRFFSFLFRNRIDDAKEAVSDSVHEYVANEVNIRRHRLAVMCLDDFLLTLGENREEIDHALELMHAVERSIHDDIESIKHQNRLECTDMRYDLSVREINEMGVGEVPYDAFQESLGGRDLLALDNEEEMKSALLDSAKSTFVHHRLMNKGVFTSLQNRTNADLLDIADMAMACSTPPGVRQNSVFHFICAENVFNNPFFQQINQPFQAGFSDLKSAILFCTIDAPFPLVMLNGIERWRLEYEREKGRFSYQFDVRIHDRMVREHYCLLNS
jgi:hypothetical protein